MIVPALSVREYNEVRLWGTKCLVTNRYVGEDTVRFVMSANGSSKELTVPFGVYFDKVVPTRFETVPQDD